MEIFGKRICHTEGGIDALSKGITNQFPVNCFKKTVQKSGNTLCNLVAGVLDLIPWDAVQCGIQFITDHSTDFCKISILPCLFNHVGNPFNL